jgi:hypothetical protein
MTILHEIVDTKTGQTLKRIEHDYEYFLFQVAVGHPAFGIRNKEYLQSIFHKPVIMQYIGCK